MNWLFLLSVITASIALLFALVFFAIYWQKPSLLQAKCWGIAFSMLVVAMCAVSARIAFPAVNPYIFSSLLTVNAALSFVFLYFGILKWRGMAPVGKWVSHLSLLVMFSVGALAMVLPAWAPWSVTLSRVYIAVFSALAVYALVTGDKPRNIGHYLAAAFLAINPIMQVVSIVLTSVVGLGSDGIAAVSVSELTHSPFTVVNFVGLPIGFTGIALFCLLGVLLDLGAEIREKALRDWLTGCYNRRGFIAVAEPLFLNSRRRDSHFSLILLDMDNFKGINDTYGHAAGDQALKTVAAALTGGVRKSDLVARWGGEEFLVLLPDANATDAQRIAEKLRRTLEQLELVLDSGKRVQLSASFGVAERCASDQKLDPIVTRADFALYSSKSAGKNRVSLSTAQD